MHRRSLFVVVCFAAACCAATARAELIIGNFPSSPDTFGTNVFDTSRKAVSFIVGSQAYVLDAAVLRMNYGSGAPIVELRNDVGGANPGNTVVASFNTPDANGGGAQSYSFTPTAATTLSANTKYWLYVYGSDSNPTLWYRSNPNVTPAGPGAAFDAYRVSTDGGGSWSSTSAYNSFELLGHTPAIPEPSSLALIATAGLAAGVRRRLFRR